MDRSSPYGSFTLAQVLEQQGKYHEALDELKRANALSPNQPWSWIVSDIAYVNAMLGKRTEAQAGIEQLKVRAKSEWIDPVLIAYVYIALNNTDEAFRWMEKAEQERAALIPLLRIEPKFSPLRDDPKFARLVQKIGLP